MKTTRKNKGAILVLSLIVLVIIFVVVTQYTYTTKVEKRLAENSEDNLEIYYAARSVMEAASAFLAEDDSPGVDSETDIWGDKYEHKTVIELYAATLGQVANKFHVQDSNRFVNLAGLWSPSKSMREDTLKLLENLARVVEADEECGVTELHLRIRDYLDNDSTGPYEFQGNLNQDLVTVDQLLDMPDVEPTSMEKLYFGYKSVNGYLEEEVTGLKKLVTVWGDNTSSPPRININTACKEVLTAVILMNNTDLDINTAEDEAEIILENRDEEEDNEDDDGTHKKFFASFGKIKADLEELECDYAARSTRWFTIMAGSPGKPQFFVVDLHSARSGLSKEIRIILERRTRPRPPNEVTFHMWREIPAWVPLKDPDEVR